jgi:hypothetical protein
MPAGYILKYIKLAHIPLAKETRLKSNNSSVAPWDPCFFFGGGGQGQYLSDKPKFFSDKPKNFPDDDMLNLHPSPPSTTLTISDNIDNFPTISDNIDNFPTGLNNRGVMAPLPPPATAPLQLFICIYYIKYSAL